MTCILTTPYHEKSLYVTNSIVQNVYVDWLRYQFLLAYFSFFFLQYFLKGEISLRVSESSQKAFWKSIFSVCFGKISLLSFICK